MLARKAVNWCDEKFENLDVEKNFSFIKAAGIGVIEGLIDSAVLLGSASLISTAFKVTKKIIKK